MNKNRIILIAIGGVCGLAVLAMLYLVWSSLAAKTAALEGDSEEGVAGLEEVETRAVTLSRAKVYPSQASVKAIEDNDERLVEWKKDARKLAARGDRVYASTTPPAFKAFIVADAKRLSALPGLANGVLVKPEFAFGPFKDFIAEGKMPADGQLAELQRRWDDVATVTELLAAAGIAELVDVQYAQAAQVEETPADAKKRKAKAKKPAKKAAVPTEPEPKAFSYVFTFTTRPAGLVKAVNSLETCDRFVTVDSFAFQRETDVVAAALGGEKKTEGAAAPRGRRGRRGAAVVEKKEEESANLKNGIVTDPMLDPPIKVTMTVTVYDFGTLEEGVTGEEVKK